jgi:hypothetical protein
VLGFSVQQSDVLSALSDRFSAKATAEALRGGAAPADMLAREYDLDPQSDRPGVPDDPRKKRDEWSAERLLAERAAAERALAERMGHGMVRGDGSDDADAGGEGGASGGTCHGRVGER